MSKASHEFDSRDGSGEVPGGPSELAEDLYDPFGLALRKTVELLDSVLKVLVLGVGT